MKTPTQGRSTLAPAFRSRFTNASTLDPFDGPNVDALERDPFTCFAEGEPPAEGGDDGGSEADRTFTQADLDKVVKSRLAAEQRKFQKQLEAAQSTPSEKVAELEAQLAEMREAAELAGKTAAEQAEHKREKERQAYERKLEEAQKAVAERDQRLAQQVATLQGERLSRALSAHLGKAKVMSEYADKAMKLASLELADVTHGEDGSITATYGDAIDAPLADAIAEWVKDNPLFLPAPAGGAGTRNNGGLGGHKGPLGEMSKDDLARLVDESDPRRAFR